MPALIPYSILVRDDASDLCPAQVSVTINNAVTDITTSFTATDASCSNNDGTIQVGAVSGGTGPYTYRLDSVDYAALPANNTFTGLAGGTHKFTVIDANGCNKYFKTTINFPGLVNFTTTFNNPDCFNSGNNGNVIATITSSGTFDVGITIDPVNDPTVFQTVVSAGFSQVTFNGLSQGTYFVVAKPVGALCPSRSLPIAIGGGPAAVDFNIIPEDFVCFETKGMVRITGIKGSTLVDYDYEIIFAGSIIQSGTITQLQALPPDTINYTGLDKGNYQMRLFQDQSVASGCASPISSSYKSFSINGPAASLDTLYVNRKFSLPNIATGSMLIGIQESQAQPYQLMLHLVTPHLEGQRNNYAFDSTWVSVSRNNQNLVMEFNAANIYGGDYRLSIRDTLGCTRTYDLSLDFDKDIYVPNVFTPNNDGKNDTFQILNLPDESKLVITNRWGKEVYRSSNYTNNWNGGSEVDGVYYYSLVAGGKTYTGWVEIMHPSF
jgi:gliding motility-associated-like protein